MRQAPGDTRDTPAATRRARRLQPASPRCLRRAREAQPGAGETWCSSAPRGLRGFAHNQPDGDVLAAGLLLAQAIAYSVFGGAVPFSALPAVASVALGAVVASLASLIPVRRAASIEPGIVLRGE